MTTNEPNSGFIVNDHLLVIVKYALYAAFYFFFFLSLTPIISWWGGAGGLLLFSGLVVVRKLRIFPAGPIAKIDLNRWTRLSAYAIAIGIIFYTVCLIYSDIKVNKLIQESRAASKTAKTAKPYK